MGSAAGMAVAVLWVPVLYGAVKIIAGVLVLHYGKQYADKIREEEKR